jgi:hypothetical protein
MRTSEVDLIPFEVYRLAHPQAMSGHQQDQRRVKHDRNRNFPSGKLRRPEKKLKTSRGFWRGDGAEH